MRAILLALFVCVLSAAALSATAGAQDTAGNTAIPKMPDPIQELVNQGAQVRYLGRDYGLDSWLTIKNGQEQYFYVLPDGSAFLMGLLFDNKGKVVTVNQVKRLQERGDTLLDSLTDEYTEAPTAQKDSEEFKSPSERMFDEVQGANWLPLGPPGAPVMYAFIDPQCPHCHAFINDLRKEYLDKGKVQLRIVPIGFRDETVAQAAYLLAAPNPQERWYRHMDGDATALPAKTDISQQGVQRNLAIMQAWKFDVTPMIVYRGKDEKVKLIKGRPKDLKALVADLGARS